MNLDELCDIDGVVLSPSGLGNADALWVNGTEIAHLDDAAPASNGASDSTIDVRIGRKNVTVHKRDPRVRARASGSDWCEVDSADVSFVRELVELAASQHRAAPGTTPKAPPGGADLERRRRFH